jgi:SAM-dependent methyltransferase
MERTWDLFKWLIAEFGYKSYLEIGCKGNTTFDRVEALTKVGVDPDRGGTLRMTSDKYFETHDQKFDLIFVDGLHERAQVLRDIDNALTRLNPGGTIVMHDCDPPSEERQRVPQGAQRGWCGDVWRAYVHVRTRLDLDVACTTFDMGMGVIRVRSNGAILELSKPAEEMTWQDLEADRAKLLRQMPEELLLRWIKDPKAV